VSAERSVPLKRPSARYRYAKLDPHDRFRRWALMEISPAVEQRPRGMTRNDRPCRWGRKCWG
jgi:hypothetical protein